MCVCVKLWNQKELLTSPAADEIKIFDSDDQGVKQQAKNAYSYAHVAFLFLTMANFITSDL